MVSFDPTPEPDPDELTEVECSLAGPNSFMRSLSRTRTRSSLDPLRQTQGKLGLLHHRPTSTSRPTRSSLSPTSPTRSSPRSRSSIHSNLRLFPYLDLDLFLIETDHEQESRDCEVMDGEPTIFDSMFHPDLIHSAFDDSRSIHGRYNVTGSSSRIPWRSRRLSHEFPEESYKPTSNARIIPIIVEHESSVSNKKGSLPADKKSSSSVDASSVIEINSENMSEKSSSKSMYSNSKNSFEKNDFFVLDDAESDILREIGRDSFHVGSNLRGKARKYILQNNSHKEETLSNLLADVMSREYPSDRDDKSSTSVKDYVNMNNNSSGSKYRSSNKEENLSPGSRSVDDDDIIIACASPNSSFEYPNPKPRNAIGNTSEEKFDEEKEVNPAPSYPIYDILKVQLEKENRQVDYIRGDGNCFFRALSKQLYGSERFHKVLRSLVVDIIATNKDKFAQFVDGEEVQDHVKRMSEDHSWATTCEIYAAATLLQRDIYMLTPNHTNDHYSWLLFRPVFVMDLRHNEVSSHPCYITLCNTNGNHYDRVIADHMGCNCFLPHPLLDGAHCSIDLTN